MSCPPVIGVSSTPKKRTSKIKNTFGLYSMILLVHKYHYPLESSAGIIGNIHHKGERDYKTAQESIVSENIGLNCSIRKHRKLSFDLAVNYNSRSKSGSILHSIDKQLGLLDKELKLKYKNLYQILKNPLTNSNTASDSFIYEFEQPKSLIMALNGRFLQREITDQDVQKILKKSRNRSMEVLDNYLSNSNIEEAISLGYGYMDILRMVTKP